MGIKQFTSFYKANNILPIENAHAHNNHQTMRVTPIVRAILIDGTYLRTYAVNIANSLYLEYYKNIFNIHHIYQYVCLKSAIICYQNIQPLISPGVEEIIIFNDNSSQSDYEKLMEEAEKLVPHYFKHLFDKSLKIKEVTKMKRRNYCNIMINNEMVSSIEVINRVIVELASSDNELASNSGDFYVNFLRNNPFLNIYITEEVGLIILTILCYFLQNHYKDIKITLIKSFLEADFSIYTYVYESFNKRNFEKILIISMDTDYFICGYHPGVYLYNMKEVIFPYQFWKVILFRYYEESIDMSEILLRISFLLGNDYLSHDIIKNDNKQRLIKLYMLLNIEQKFRQIPSRTEGKQLKAYFNKFTHILKDFKEPFSPDLVDLVILSGLSNKVKSIYITCLYCLKHIKNMHIIDNMQNSNIFRVDSLLSSIGKLSSEIKQEWILNKSGIKFEINPFLYKEFYNNDSLYKIMKNNLFERLINRTKMVKQLPDRKRCKKRELSIREEDVLKDYMELIEMVNINLDNQ